MATTNAVLRARVERGAALLDAEKPGWCERIDVPTLDIRDANHCVLAQVYPSFSEGLTELDIWEESLGFSSGADDYPKLETLWREAIEARCEGSGA